MDEYMLLALKEAKKAFKKDEIPVGAVLVHNDMLLAKAYNNRMESHLVTGHAEINVINKACEKLKYWKLKDCILYVTLKPCKMCYEVIREAGISKVYYLVDPLDIKKNRYECNVDMDRVDDKEISEEYKNLLKNFFENKR